MLTQTPFAGLDAALYGRTFDDMRARRDQRERDARNARLASLKRSSERVTVKVSATFRAVYPYLSEGEHILPRRVLVVHRDNVREMLSDRKLSLGQRNAARAMLRKLDTLAA